LVRHDHESRRLIVRAHVAIAAAWLALAPIAHAEALLDQIADGEGTSSGQSFVDKEREFAETFTVGVAGVLSRIDVKLQGSIANVGDLRFDVVALQENGLPVEDGAQALATGVVPLDAIPTSTWDWVALDGLAIPVAVGDRLGVVLRVAATSDDVYSWLIASEANEGGSGHCRGVCSATWLDLFIDYRIRTWVDPDVELDQSSDSIAPVTGQSFLDAFTPAFAQTFEVGRDGVLTRFDVLLRASDGAEDLHWDVMPLTQAGAPLEDLGLAIASGTIAAADAGVYPGATRWVSVTGLDVPVQQGERLAIALSVPLPTTSVYVLSVAAPYLGGAAFCRRPEADPTCGGVWGEISQDYRFRSFLLPVPEPASGASAFVALLALALRARCRARP
jgi:hypothetical protein